MIKYGELNTEEKLEEYDFIEGCIIDMLASWDARDYDLHILSMQDLMGFAYDTYWTDVAEVKDFKRRIKIVASADDRKMMVLHQVFQILDNRINSE